MTKALRLMLILLTVSGAVAGSMLPIRGRAAKNGFDGGSNPFPTCPVWFCGGK